MKIKPLFNEHELNQMTDYQLVTYVNNIYERLGFVGMRELNEDLATKVTKQQYIEYIKAIHTYLEWEITEMLEYLMIMHRVAHSTTEDDTDYNDINDDYTDIYDDYEDYKIHNRKTHPYDDNDDDYDVIDDEEE